jgi:hypothetical protein
MRKKRRRMKARKRRKEKESNDTKSDFQTSCCSLGRSLAPQCG